MDRQIHLEVNALRADPCSAVQDLQLMLQQFQGESNPFTQHLNPCFSCSLSGNVLKRPGKIDLLTKEGASAVRECIAFLKVKPPPIPIS